MGNQIFSHLHASVFKTISSKAIKSFLRYNWIQLQGGLCYRCSSWGFNTSTIATRSICNCNNQKIKLYRISEVTSKQVVWKTAEQMMNYANKVKTEWEHCLWQKRNADEGVHSHNKIQNKIKVSTKMCLSATYFWQLMQNLCQNRDDNWANKSEQNKNKFWNFSLKFQLYYTFSV